MAADGREAEEEGEDAEGLHVADEAKAEGEILQLFADVVAVIFHVIGVKLADEGGEVEEAVGVGEEKEGNCGEEDGGSADVHFHAERVAEARDLWKFFVVVLREKWVFFKGKIMEKDVLIQREKFWLIKSEPDVFSIDDLARVGREPWSGVRNYQARNFMWKEMREGDVALFYHSNATPPGVVGLARVVGEAYADETQFEVGGEYEDGKATREKPRWYLVDFSFVEKFSREIPLAELRENAALEGMLLLQKGTRLSITPVAEEHFREVLRMAGSRFEMGGSEGLSGEGE